MQNLSCPLLARRGQPRHAHSPRHHTYAAILLAGLLTFLSGLEVQAATGLRAGTATADKAAVKSGSGPLSRRGLRRSKQSVGPADAASDSPVALPLAVAATIAGDTDGDGVDDAVDNCTLAWNPDQQDANRDGYGNRCDADLNENGLVDSQDAALIKAAFGLNNHPDRDINGNGTVDSEDASILKSRFGQAPGPSAIGSPPVPSIFPLRVEAGKRYLVDAQGRPFLMNGDTAWSLMVQLNPAEVETYLESRRQLGINTVLVSLIEHTFGSNAPRNREGNGPFLTPGNYATPNDAYFDYADFVVDLAATKGMLVLLTPSYMGYQGGAEGWYQEMVANGATTLRNYGRYVGQHFAGRDNVLWVHGGDFDPPVSPGLQLANAIQAGIAESDPDGRWLHTFHADRGTSARSSSAGSQPWLSVNNIYTSSTDVVAEAFAEYPSSPQPFFLIEARYENDGGDGPFIRLQAYQALLSGASGHLMGNDPMWYLGANWRNVLDSEGARSMPFINALFTSRDWWLLVPDKNASFLTGGVGSGEARAASALASDGSFGLVFTPSQRTLTVNLARLAGPGITASWFDPAAGTYTTIAGSPFSAAGSRSFTPAALNSQGARDWVLVLESSSQ